MVTLLHKNISMRLFYHYFTIIIPKINLIVLMLLNIFNIYFIIIVLTKFIILRKIFILPLLV